MKTLYEASSVLEAHMLLELLKQEGLSAQIQGEHLVGAIGELPTAGLVRLLIDETEFAQARALVERWDAAQPKEPIAERAPKKPRTLRIFLLGLAIGVGASYLYFRTPVSINGVDHNGDGVLDEKWTYASSGARLKFEADRNLDGKIDHIAHSDRGGLIEIADADDNFDGVFETRMRFRDGNVEISETDTDGDGYRDFRSRYTNGVLFSAEFMDPLTFRPLRIEYFKLDKLTKAEVDTDKDGKFDTRYIYNALGEVSATEKIPQ